MLVLPLTHPLRRLLIRVVESAWFDRLILVLIVANSLLLAIAGPDTIPVSRASLHRRLRLRPPRARGTGPN
jgi:hypothetical protein